MSQVIIHGRFRALEGLWQLLCKEKKLPQLDRWLAEQLRRQRKTGSKDRRWLTTHMFSIWRFSPLNFILADPDLPEAADADAMAAAIEGLWPKYTAIDPIAFMAALGKLDLRVVLFFTARLQNAFTAIHPPLSAKLSPIEMVDPAIEGLLPAGEDRNPVWSLIAACLPAGADSGHEPRVQPRLRLSRELCHGIPHDKRTALADRRQASFDEADYRLWLSMQFSRPPVWIRIVQKQASGTVIEALQRDASASVLEQCGQRAALEAPRSLYEAEAFKAGWFEIQDWASQDIAAAVAAQPGDFVWDACAGAGGKTLAIADRLGGKGVIYASDIREWKLEELSRRAKRAGYFQIRTLKWDGGSPSFPGEAGKKGGFDWVVVDAPCSSSGTWRRNPEAKYRFHAGDLGELTDLQLRLLTNAAGATNRSGRLVYATCSYFMDENENLVQRFLSSPAGANYRLEDQRLLGCPGKDADTMFVAVMRREHSRGS